MRLLGLARLQGSEQGGELAHHCSPLSSRPVPLPSCYSALHVQPDLPEGTKCFVTGKPAKNWALWGRSY